MSNSFRVKIWTAALLFLVAAANLAEARIGENYRQCVARYGSSYTNFPGLDHLLGVAIFEKSGINVTVAFDRPNKQGFLVLYTGGRFLSQYERKNAADLKDNEIDALMASLNVSWDSPKYEPPKAGTSKSSRIDPSMRSFAGPRKVKGGSYNAMPSTTPTKKENAAPKPPKWTENLSSAREAVKGFVEAITLENPSYNHGYFHFRNLEIAASDWSTGSRIVDHYSLKPYRRSGDHLFAFKLFADSKCYGLVLINSDAAKAISGWAEAYVKSHDKPPPKEKGRTLQGF